MTQTDAGEDGGRGEKTEKETKAKERKGKERNERK